MFTIVGERINTSRKNIRKAVETHDEDAIRNEVIRQQDAGADFIDVNAGARIGHEDEDMKWLLNVIQQEASVPLCLDTPDPGILEMALPLVKEVPMINSISLEKERFDQMSPLLKNSPTKVIALCMDDSGMPSNDSEIIRRAEELVNKLDSIGIPQDHIFIDPLIQPVSTDTSKGIMVIDAVKAITSKFPESHVICGLSNISYGLPQRKIINRTFLILMMAAGMDSAILDPLDAKIMGSLRTTLMLLGQDPYCSQFIRAVREGTIGS